VSQGDPKSGKQDFLPIPEPGRKAINGKDLQIASLPKSLSTKGFAQSLQILFYTERRELLRKSSFRRKPESRKELDAGSSPA
jgi:hypothetical protein